MSVKYDNFKRALENLCLDHDVQLATTSYGNLQVWDLDDREPIYEDYIEDRTEEK